MNESRHSAWKGSASGAGSAAQVGLGIFLSRIAGLIRDRVFAHFLGSSDAADAFKAAFRIPNMLQNLFGEGVLSASFIPVYARQLAEGREEEAGRTAGAIAAILGLVVSLFVLLGVVFTPILITVIAPGFIGAKRDLTIELGRILFPGAGLMVLSAWCLGILNSHRRFFLSYSAPIFWNLVMIASQLGFGPRMGQEPLTVVYAWASVLGSALQFLLQLPTVLRVSRSLRLSLDFHSPPVKAVLHNFIPVFFGRGVTQISAFIDEMIASLLPTGALAGLGYAQTLYLLPVSLFGMSVSAAELPAMSSATGDPKEIAGYLADRLNGGLRRIAYFIIPSSAAFLILGDVIVAAIYQTGHFVHHDVVFVWTILAGYAFGLLAATQSRLYSSAYYALRDARTPFRLAVVRVSVSAALGLLLALAAPRWLGLAPRWGVAGLTLAAGIASWLEFWLLRRKMKIKVGSTGLQPTYVLKLLGCALAAALIAFLVKQTAVGLHPIWTAALVLSLYGGLYILLTGVAGVMDRRIINRLFSRLTGR